MPAKILIVDDDPNVQRLLTYTIRQEGYEVITAGGRRRGLPDLVHRAPGPRAPRCHAAQARRLPGRTEDPRRRGRRTRPDRHAHGREGSRAEGPRPPRRCRRLPGSSRSIRRNCSPGSRACWSASRPKERPVSRPPLGRILAFYGAKGGVGTTTIAINSAIALHRELGRRVALVDGNLQFGDHRVFLDLGLDRKSIVDVVSAPTIDIDLMKNVLVRHDSGIDLLLAPPSPETAELVTQDDLPQILDQLRSALRLRPDRYRQAPRRGQPARPRRRRHDLRRHDGRPVLSQERAPGPRDDRPSRLRGGEGPPCPEPVERVHRHQCEECGRRAEAHDRAPDRQRVPRRDLGANSGAPFMFTKADSLIGRSLLDFTRSVDRQVPATAPALRLALRRALPRPGDARPALTQGRGAPTTILTT